jgi:hypothetical protein
VRAAHRRAARPRLRVARSWQDGPIAIYLDTNVVCRWRTFGELERLALSILADQLVLPIVLPELVVVEATAHQRRDLVVSLERFEAATEELVAAFGLEYTMIEPTPDPDGRAARWRERLLEMCEVVPIHPPDAVEALEREVHGIPPARERIAKKQGMGARDAAIWLAILRDHRERGEVGHLITKDTGDFLEGDRLKPRLLADLEIGVQMLHVHAGIAEMLEAMGTSSGSASIEADELTVRAAEAINTGLAESPVAPRAVFETLEGHRFQTKVKSAEALEVKRVRRFAREGDSVILVDAEWVLVADLLFQDPGTEEPEKWGRVHEVTLRGRLQVYLPDSGEDEARAQLIAAQLLSEKEVVFLPDGKLLITG